MILILKSKHNNHYARAEMKNSKEIKVLKGSRINLEDSFGNMTRKAAHFRQDNKYVNSDGILLKDVSFNSVSTAAQFVTGRSVNGYIAWRVDDKMSLKEYISNTPFQINVISKNDIERTVRLSFSSKQVLVLMISDIKYFYDKDKYCAPILNNIDVRLNSDENPKVFKEFNDELSKFRTITFIVLDKTNKEKWAVSVSLLGKKTTYKRIINW